MNTPLDSFETALLSRLREQVSEPGPVPHRSRVVRRAGLGIAAAVALAGGATLLPGIGDAPAYSVQEGNSGEIIVKVNRPEDAPGLQAELARHGVQSDIVFLDDRQQCAPGRYTPVDRRVSGMQISIGSDILSVTLPPGAVREGETFVLGLSGEAIAPATEPNEDGTIDMGGYSAWTEFDVASGPVLPCRAVDNSPAE